MKNLQLQEKGIKFNTCSVGGHNEHGLVERVIRCLQDSMEEAGLKHSKLSATGLQTMCKLVENELNNIPLGFKYDRDSDNTEVLKLITPNMMKLGRINTRSLSCPLRLPHGASEMVERVRKSYETWFKLWSTAYVPKVMFKPKWYKTDVDLKIGDVVFFPKSTDSDGKDEDWIIGRVCGLDRGRDGIIRKALVKYRNASEAQDCETERSIRRLCKLWSEDDWNIQDDLSELNSRLKDVADGQLLVNRVRLQYLGIPSLEISPEVLPKKSEDGCCCPSHCTLLHSLGKPLRSYKALNLQSLVLPSLDPVLPSLDSVSPQLYGPDVVEESLSKDDLIMDNLTDVLLSLNLG